MGLDYFPISFFIHIPICTSPLRFSAYLDLSFNSHLHGVSQPLATHGENQKQQTQSVSADFTHSLPDAPSLSVSVCTGPRLQVCLHEPAVGFGPLSLHCILACPIFSVYLFSQICLTYLQTLALSLPPCLVNLTSLPRNQPCSLSH